MSETKPIINKEQQKAYKQFLQRADKNKVLKKNYRICTKKLLKKLIASNVPHVVKIILHDSKHRT